MKRKPMRMTQILVGLVAAIVAVTLAVWVTLYLHQYRAAAIQNAGTSSAQAVSQVAGTVGNYMEELGETMDLVVDQVQGKEEDQAEFFSAFLRIRPAVIAVTRYDEQGNLVDCRALNHTPRKEILKNLSFDLEKARNASGRVVTAPHVETIFQGYYPWVVTIIDRVTTPESSGWVALDLSFSGSADTINNVGIGRRGYCFLLDDSGSIVYHPQQQLLYAGLKSEDTARLGTLADGIHNDGTVIYCLQTVPNSNWRVVGVSFVDELVNTSFRQMIRTAVGIAAVVLAAALVAGWVLSGLLTRPLRLLEGAMEQFEQDAAHFTYQPVDGPREVRELSDSFGHMVVRIQQLMGKVREEEINLRKTELKALQAQINPHFLYNTLDSIAWMCERGRNADAVQMVHALARLFRISISKGHELIPVAREIEHATSYLQIQKYRYKNQFTYHFDVDPACNEYLCNKITLQPIIENAITHGLDLLVEEGHIEVKVRQDGGDIVFEVSDNGVGMEPEQVEAMMRREPSDRTGIGIKNVNDRLRIYFGEQYGLTIHSVPDEGTTVIIRMPKIKEGEYEETR